MEKLYFSLAEKSALRAVLDGADIHSAAVTNGLSNRAVKAAFEQFQSAIKEAMREAGRRFVENSLASSPTGDPIEAVKMALGWQTDEDFDDTAPDYLERQAAKHMRTQSSKVDSLLGMMNKIGVYRSWQLDDTSIDETAAEVDPLAQFEVTPELADSRRISREAFTKAIEENPAIKADDDLRVALGTVAWEMADIMAGMPADQQQAFIDEQIADWLEANQ